MRKDSNQSGTNPQPQLSIIVPFYNTESYIAKCLAALVGQTYADMEILLIDDASTDKSLLIAEDFVRQDKRVRLLNKEITPPPAEKMGVARARNLGLDAARGKYIMFCDSDDYYEPNMVELMIKAMEENPEADLASCSAKIHEISERDEGAAAYFRNEKTGLFVFTEELKAKEAVCLWNKIFRKDIFDHYKLRCRKFTPQASDSSLSLKYFSVSRNIYHIQAELYNYALREDSTFHKGLQEKHILAQYIIANISDLADFLDNNRLWANNTQFFARQLKIALWIFPESEGYEKNFAEAYKAFVELARRIKAENIIEADSRGQIIDNQKGRVKGVTMPAGGGGGCISGAQARCAGCFLC